MPYEQNGKWSVINFFFTKYKMKLVLAKYDSQRIIFLDKDLLKFSPELFGNSKNLYGMSYSDYQVDNMIKANEQFAIRLIFTKMLAMRDYSIRALKEKALKNKKVNHDLIDEVIDQMIKEGRINEEKTIQSYLAALMKQKGYGRDRVRHRMIEVEKFDELLVKEYLRDVPEAEFDKLAQETANKIQKKLQTNRFQTQQKVRRGLINRGFGEDTADSIISNISYSNHEGEALQKDLDRMKRKYRNIKGKSAYYNKIVTNLQRLGYNFYYIDQVFPKGEKE